MANSHYYSREKGEVIERPPANPDYVAGLNSGRKQRTKDQKKGDYPRGGLPISRNRGEIWVKAYQSAYYQPALPGRKMLGDEPRVKIQISVDRQLLSQLDALGVSRSEIFQRAAEQLVGHPNSVAEG